ncbi:hypothetical protein SAMN03159453_00994 [Pseudomonas sp. NFIX28]|nr:hypothetical protein SAMN03159453_00994 [Pseudomonas sp. NFIX28]
MDDHRTQDYQPLLVMPWDGFYCLLLNHPKPYIDEHLTVGKSQHIGEWGLEKVKPKAFLCFRMNC